MATKKRNRKSSGSRRYGPAANRSVESAMRRRKRGTLRRGKQGAGGRVTGRKQAIAIGLSEAREKGAKLPSRRRSASEGTSTRRRGATARGTSSTSTRRRSTGRGTTTRRRRSSGAQAGSRRKSASTSR